VCIVNGIIDFDYINYLLIICLLSHAGGRSNYFVVGLTNVSPWVKRPNLWQYTLCGQYPGTVPNRPNTQVSLYCRENLPPFRYVVVQIPMRTMMNVCEIEVHVRGVPCILLCCIV